MKSIGQTGIMMALVVALVAGVETTDAADKSDKTERPRIAVADLKVVGDVGIKDAGQAVAEFLLTSFNTKKYQLVERTHLVAILKEHDLTIAKIVDNPALLRGKKLKGVKYLVVGSVIKFGDISIAARVVDVTTGVIGKKAKVSAEDARALKPQLAELAKVLSGEKATADKAIPKKALTLTLPRDVTIELVPIAPGRFIMGSPETEKARDAVARMKSRDKDEGPRRRVTISKPFYMGIFEVTQAQWKAVMGTQPWDASSIKARADYPANYITWKEATAFCAALSRKTRRTVRLPTEAEWEYACRAGTTTMFSFGDDPSRLGLYAWHDPPVERMKSMNVRHPAYGRMVGTKKPNAWGLYDMHGNVYEWCSDWYVDSYANAGARDPKGPSSGKSHIRRGGSWNDGPVYCRAASRSTSSSDRRSCYSGFRVVVESGVD